MPSETGKACLVGPNVRRSIIGLVLSRCSQDYPAAHIRDA